MIAEIYISSVYLLVPSHNCCLLILSANSCRPT